MYNNYIMVIHIFNVEHGNCSLVILPSGERIMIDCGHNSTTGWRPSYWVSQNGGWITNLTITNFDEDHVSDLANIYPRYTVRSLCKNWNVDAQWIRTKKAQTGIGPGINTLLTMINNFTGPPLDTTWGGALVERFCLSPSQYNDENSLSLVTFIQFLGIRIVFPGDLTHDGWQALLRNERFRQLLSQTNIFIASHHGRQNGYCEEVFNLCNPSIIIISDKCLSYDTQQVDYRQYASGITWNQSLVRYVLTTRNDGNLKIENDQYESFIITAYGS